MEHGDLEATLYHVAANWLRSPASGSERLVRAACDALIEGVDTPALVDLAGASGRETRSELEPVVTRLAQDFGWEWPPPREGLLPFRPYPRPGAPDRLDLDVRQYPAGEFGEWPGLAILINGEDWTRRTAGAGMAPTSMFAPVPVLGATEEPHVAVVACCEECGQPECSSATVRITRDGDLVVWEWLDEDAIWQVHLFSADEYTRTLDSFGGRVSPLTQNARSTTVTS